MSSPTENLEFVIGLSAKASESLQGVQPVIEKGEQIKKELAELLEKIRQELDKDKANPKKQEVDSTPKQKETEKKKEEEDKSEGLEFIESLDTKQLSNAQSLFTNPVSFVQSQALAFLTKLGPANAAIIGLVTAAVSSPAVLEAIIKVMSQPGGPFNRDWRRFVELQIDIGLSRIEEERKATGRDVSIFTQGKRGFVPENEVWSSSNQVLVNENRLARIGLNSTEEGLLD